MKERMFPQGCFLITLQTGKLAPQDKINEEANKKKTFRGKYFFFLEPSRKLFESLMNK
jgi:hypothetical protein